MTSSEDSKRIDDLNRTIVDQLSEVEALNKELNGRARAVEDNQEHLSVIKAARSTGMSKRRRNSRGRIEAFNTAVRVIVNRMEHEALPNVPSEDLNRIRKKLDSGNLLSQDEMDQVTQYAEKIIAIDANKVDELDQKINSINDSLVVARKSRASFSLLDDDEGVDHKVDLETPEEPHYTTMDNNVTVDHEALALAREENRVRQAERENKSFGTPDESHYAVARKVPDESHYAVARSVPDEYIYTEPASIPAGENLYEVPVSAAKQEAIRETLADKHNRLSNRPLPQVPEAHNGEESLYDEIHPIDLDRRVRPTKRVGHRSTSSPDLNNVNPSTDTMVTRRYSGPQEDSVAAQKIGDRIKKFMSNDGVDRRFGDSQPKTQAESSLQVKPNKKPSLLRWLASKIASQLGAKPSTKTAQPAIPPDNRPEIHQKKDGPGNTPPRFSI